MGKSAKVHKRVPKKLKSSTQSSSTPSVHIQVQNAQKQVIRKHKAANRKGSSSGNGPVLGGVDYVTLMMGGRRKAQEEATKLLHGDDE